MANLPRVTGKEAARAFALLGWQVKRQSSSHIILGKEGHIYHLSIPDHGHKSLKAGLLRSQIRLAGITVDEFVEALRQG